MTGINREWLRRKIEEDADLPVEAGADGAVVYYELVPRVYDPARTGAFHIRTAATIVCSLCGAMIDGMGGPGNGPVCLLCGDALQTGKLRGSVKWSAA